MNIFFRIIVALVLCLLPAAAYGQPPAYTVVKEKSYVKFIAIAGTTPHEGRFESYSADIRFDPENLKDSSIKVEVDVAGVKVAADEVQKMVTLPEWLSAELFPTASFVSKTIIRMPSTDNYYAEGTLTLRGKALPATLNFRMEHFDAEGAVASGYVSLARKDFGIGQGEWAGDDVVKNEVRVEFRIAAEKTP
jgi:polyisoprenoid-binding protein YceI